MLSNKPDDVIVIDNTDIDYNRFDTKDLIDEMIGIKSEDLPTFCGTIER